MKRLVFTNDFLFHGQEDSNLAFHNEWFSILQIPAEIGTGCKFEKITDCRNDQGEPFSRSRFYELSGIRDIAPRHFAYEISAVKKNSWNYFKSFFDTDTVFIGAELGSDLRKWMTDEGYVYVNFWYHPYKLLDDIFFLVGSNDPVVYEKLSSFKIPFDKLRFYSRYYATQSAFRGHLDSLPILDNCCLFVGQTFRDKSVQCGTRFLSIVDFGEKIDELAKSFSKIYYVPHPCAEPNPDVDAFIRNHGSVELLADVPTYYLLSSPKVAKVVSLSSSVVYEASTFGKQAEYLYKPLFDIDGAFSLDAFSSIYEHYFAPSFWRTILDCDTVLSNPVQGTLMDVSLGKLRNLVGAPWGFKHLGRLELIEEELRMLRNQSNEVTGFVRKIKGTWPYKVYSHLMKGIRKRPVH